MLKNPPTTSRVHANAMSAKMVAKPPPITKGLLLPHLMRHLSLFKPTNGCTKTPDSGPASQTRASMALLMPRDSRYGEPLDISTDQPICKPSPPSVRRNMYQLLLVCCSSREPQMWSEAVSIGETAFSDASFSSSSRGCSNGDCSFA